jgi:hypothetical protein
MNRNQELKESFNFAVETIAKMLSAKAEVKRRGSWIYVDIVGQDGVLFSAKGRGYLNAQRAIAEKMQDFIWGTE